MQISTFVYSEDSFGEPIPEGQRLHLVNPQNVFRPIFIPSMFSFSFTIGFIGVDTLQEHKMRIIFSNPDGSKQLIDTGEIAIPKNEKEDDIPVEMRGLMMNMGFKNVAFEVEGIYRTEVFFDGERIGVFPVGVKRK